MSVETRVHDLIEHLKSGKVLDAFDKFYDEKVTMQENSNPPTTGKAANRKREEEFVASVKQWKGLNVSAVAVTGERDDGTAFIEYDFDFINQQGEPVHYEQVSVQRWKNGKVVREKFYYDTAH